MHESALVRGRRPRPVVSLLLRLGLLPACPSTAAVSGGLGGAPHHPISVAEGGRLPGESWRKVCTLGWGSPSYL